MKSSCSRYSFDELMELAGHRFASRSKAIQAIELIREKFLKERENIEQAYQGREFLSAYLLYFFPSNYAKLSEAFTRFIPKLSDWLSENSHQIDFYDIGCGPGTYSLAMLDWCSSLNRQLGSVHLIESNSEMRKLAIRLLDHFHPAWSDSAESMKEQSLKRIRVALFGNSLNEMSLDQAFKYLDSINPDIVLLLEPGTRQSFQKVIELREALVEQREYDVHYPCPSNQACPMASTSINIEKIQDSLSDDWCHQYLDLDLSQEAMSLYQAMKKDRKKAPVIFHSYVKKSLHSTYPRLNDFQESQKTNQRIVEVKKPLKFGREVRTCHFDEESQASNQIKTQKLLFKGLNGQEKKQIKNLKAGDSLKD